MDFDNDVFDEKIRYWRTETKFTPGWIAQQIGTTNEFVYFRLKKMGLPVSKRNKLRSPEGLRLAYQNGATYAEMERTFGVSGGVISSYARKWGLPRRKALTRIENLDDEIIIRKYVNELWSVKRIEDS